MDTDRMAFRAEVDNTDWVERIIGNLVRLKKGGSYLSVYKVPIKLRKVNEDVYNPQVVSIGPFHWGKNELVAMEEHKKRYMLSLLERQGTPGLESRLMEECGKWMLQQKSYIRGSYAENIGLNDEKLAEIMLVDGCFILELFVRSLLGHPDDDHIFQNAWMIPSILCDLLMIENQIPFFVLERLFVGLWGSKGWPWSSASELAWYFFNKQLHVSQKPIDGNRTVRHLLDLLQKSYLPTSPVMSTRKDSESMVTNGFDHSAVELLMAGILFEKGVTPKIEFSDGVIKMPPLIIDEYTHLVLSNLIAGEQCSLESTVTSYAMFMKSLIRNSEDVKLLKKKEIIVIKDDQDVTDVVRLFRSVLKEVRLNNFLFSSLCEEVQQYQKSHWNRQRCKVLWMMYWTYTLADLNQNYLYSPWKVIGVLVGGVLLFLTLVQTVYTVASYYPH